MEKGYWKKWYKKNKKHFLELINKHKKARRQQFQEIINKAKDKPCIICGKKFPPIAMDLYHRDNSDRKFRISEAKRLIYNIDKLIQEINKCDVYCAICRKIVETEEAIKQRDPSKLSKKRKRRLLRDLVSGIKNKPCVDCGKIFPPYAMELDHVSGKKEKAVCKMINENYDVDKIKDEVGKTEVRCLICHRIKTKERRDND